jgi:hypothetical protein
MIILPVRNWPWRQWTDLQLETNVFEFPCEKKKIRVLTRRDKSNISLSHTHTIIYSNTWHNFNLTHALLIACLCVRWFVDVRCVVWRLWLLCIVFLILLLFLCVVKFVHGVIVVVCSSDRYFVVWVIVPLFLYCVVIQNRIIVCVCVWFMFCNARKYQKHLKCVVE